MKALSHFITSFGTRGSGTHSERDVRNELHKSSLEGGGLRSDSEARRRGLALRASEFENGQNSPWHQHLSRLKPYSPQGETFTGWFQHALSRITDSLSIPAQASRLCGIINSNVCYKRDACTSLLKNFAKPLHSLRPSRLFLLLILFLISFSTQAQTIPQYQQEAAENNPELKAKYQQYLSALEESPIMGTLPDPEVSFSYFIKPIETRVGPQQGRISISQMLPWFGSLKDQRSASDLRAKAAFESFQESRNRIFLQVEQTLLEIYELDESIRIAEENQMILNSLVELSLTRYETDRATQVDVLRAQIEEEDLNIQIELLKDNREVLIQKINELLNRNEGAKIILPDSLEDTEIESREKLMAQIQQQNPNLNRLRYQEASSDEMKSLAQKQNRPSIKLGVDYIFTGETDMPNVANSGEDALMVMAGFKVPLFGKKNNAKVLQAERNIQDVQYQISSRENSLQTELDASLRDYEDAQRRFNLYNEKQIQRITQAINIMMDAYASDSSEFEEILRMQRKQLEYQLKRIQAKTEQHKAVAYIQYLSGEHNVNEVEM